MYDSYGNITSITDARGNTTSFGYDANHIYLTSLINALSHTTNFTYDFDTGLLTSITDAKGNDSSFEYDILGRITKKINPDLTEKEAVYNDQMFISQKHIHTTIRGISKHLLIQEDISTPMSMIQETD